MKNRVRVNRANVIAGACPGSAGCPGGVGGVTVLMGRGNAAAPDSISGDVIASAANSEGLSCSHNPPGTTAICLGNDSEIAGACLTGGGAISSPEKCGGGADTSGASSTVAALPQAISDAALLSESLATLTPTQPMSAIVISGHGDLTISSTRTLNVISTPLIASGTGSTITLNGGSSDIFVINVGDENNAGALQIGNGASIVLTGGITPDRVIFNLVGKGTMAQLGNHIVFNGTILASDGQFTSGDGDTPEPVVINGSLLFGGSMAVGNNTDLNFYPFMGADDTGEDGGPTDPMT